MNRRAEARRGRFQSSCLGLFGAALITATLAMAPRTDAAGGAASAADAVAPAPHAALTTEERQWARIAWRYFEQNTDPATGLTSSVAGFASTTMWDLGSSLAALIAAHRLGLIDRDQFDSRASRALDTLSRLPLFEGVLPNKVYRTHSLAMIDYDGVPTDHGLGWSVLDICRLLVPLTILRRESPGLAAAADRALARWDLSKLVRDGKLIGTSVIAGRTESYEEGHLAYQQYGARAAALVGLDPFREMPAGEMLGFVTVEGIAVPIDKREFTDNRSDIFVTSEPYALIGLEFGFDGNTRSLAEKVYAAQEARFRRTGILTAVSESHLEGPPYFAYATVYGDHAPWAVLTGLGVRYDGQRTLSTRTAFAWNALFATGYTARLLDAVRTVNDPDHGWYEGRYENDGRIDRQLTANTNAMVLLTLAYRAFGPLLNPLPAAASP